MIAIGYRNGRCRSGAMGMPFHVMRRKRLTCKALDQGRSSVAAARAALPSTRHVKLT
jgi:hypothetical protein